MCLNHSKISGPWKNCLPWNWSLVPRRLGTTALGYVLLQYILRLSDSNLRKQLYNVGSTWRNHSGQGLRAPVRAELPQQMTSREPGKQGLPPPGVAQLTVRADVAASWKRLWCSPSLAQASCPFKGTPWSGIRLNRGCGWRAALVF